MHREVWKTGRQVSRHKVIQNRNEMGFDLPAQGIKGRGKKKNDPEDKTRTF